MIAAWISVGLILLVAIVALIVEHETKKRKQNIRLPRRTAWDRFRQYQDRQRTN